mgnify:CR=1 FL=1
MFSLALLRCIDHINVPSYKRVCAIITLQRIFEIVYVQKFINSPVIKQMIHLIFFHNPLFIYKMQFLSSKTAWPSSRCNCIALILFTWWRHIDKCIAIIYLVKLTVADFPSDEFPFDCKYVSFCIWVKHLYTTWNWSFFSFSLSSHVVILMWCPFKIFYQIRPRPLIACLNCAAQNLRRFEKQAQL